MKKNFKCEKCGGLLRFNPRTKLAECEKCGSDQSVDFDKQILRHKINMDGEVQEPSIDDYSLKCISCGASFQGGSFKIMGTCQYCGSHLVEDFDLSLSLKPDGVIPFAFDKEEARERFKAGIKKKAFLPNAFKRTPPDSDIQSIYIPAFVFDCESTTEYKGRLAYRESRGNETIYREDKISGTQYVDDRGILIECSEYMTQLNLDSIKPFDLSGEYSYNPIFLMGYSVEHFNRKLSDVRDMVKQIHSANVRRIVLENYSYDSVKSFNAETHYISSNYGYIILPTYKIAYSYKGKTYNTFMNGQTGKIDSNLPKSGWKIFLTVLAVLGVIGGFLSLLAWAVGQ